MAEAVKPHVLRGLPSDRFSNLLWALAMLRHKPPVRWLHANLAQVITVFWGLGMGGLPPDLFPNLVWVHACRDSGAGGPAIT